MKIGGRDIQFKSEPFVIAEVAQTHDGSLGQALAFIDIAADCGADAVKFQTHIASEESTINEPWRIKFSNQDESRYDYWQRMTFKRSWWSLLKERADSRGIVFLSSPFSPMAVEWLDNLNIEAWKIASGEVDNEPLISAIELTGKPVLISTGLTGADRVKPLVHRLTNQGIEVAVLHCTTMYPTPPEAVGMNVFEGFGNEFDADIVLGLSDHSGTSTPSVIATYLGARVIEVHLTMHKKMFGPDVSSSLDPEELSRLITEVKFASRMSFNTVRKAEQLVELDKVKTMFSRSLVYGEDMPSGFKLTADKVAYKKPGGGLSYDYLAGLVGRVLNHDVKKDAPLKFTDFSDVPE